MFQEWGLLNERWRWWLQVDLTTWILVSSTSYGLLDVSSNPQIVEQFQRWSVPLLRRRRHPLGFSLRINWLRPQLWRHRVVFDTTSLRQYQVLLRVCLEILLLICVLRCDGYDLPHCWVLRYFPPFERVFRSRYSGSHALCRCRKVTYYCRIVFSWVRQWLTWLGPC